MTALSPLGAAAVAYVRRGWAVFPVEPGGKRPAGQLVPHGLKQATAEVRDVERWWSKLPDANIGLRTGLTFDAIDVDGPEALERLSAVMPATERSIDGPTVATPRGWHGYVAVTGHGNTVNLGGITGIDWRGAGGYVVAPPSMRADGGTWSWMVPGDPVFGADGPIRPAPAWLLALFDRREVVSRSPSRPDSGDGTPYGRAALEGELGRLLMAPAGTRNHQLNKAAFAIGRLIAGGHLVAQPAIEALLVAADRIGLPPSEAKPTIASGLRSGQQRPAVAS